MLEAASDDSGCDNGSERFLTIFFKIIFLKYRSRGSMERSISMAATDVVLGQPRQVLIANDWIIFSLSICV